MQLLQITSIPIKYEYHIEPARLELKQSQNPNYKLNRDPSQMNIDSKNIEVRLDTTDLRASLNQRSPTEFAKYYGDKGRQAIYEGIGERVQFGNQIQHIEDGVTIAQVVKQKLLEQPTTYTTFLPSVGPEIGWEPQTLDLNYDPGAVNFDWHIMRNQMDYIPGKYQMNITQYPQVQIEYLGEPYYVPPSSAPNYQEQGA